MWRSRKAFNQVVAVMISFMHSDWDLEMLLAQERQALRCHYRSTSVLRNPFAHLPSLRLQPALAVPDSDSTAARETSDRRRIAALIASVLWYEQDLFWRCLLDRTSSSGRGERGCCCCGCGSAGNVCLHVVESRHPDCIRWLYPTQHAASATSSLKSSQRLLPRMRIYF